ncbi:MAG: hypothetical protein M1839_004455 [Geoglossum umbratile]|nr:MAG: hypothetical protein M1839_004455 [Geoglossum umbratile]
MESKQFPVTFGIELELVLLPKVDVINRTLRRNDGLRALFDKCCRKVDPVTTDETKKRAEERAQFIAEFAEIVLEASHIAIKWADSEAAKKANAEGKYYDWWTVVDEVAIKVDENKAEWSVEIVSHPFSLSDLWRTEIRAVWSFVEKYFTIVDDKRGSTHCHMKLAPPSADQEIPTALAFAKQVSKFLVVWEPCLYVCAPIWRQTRNFVKSNLVGSRPLWRYLKANAGEGRYRDLFQKLDEFQHLEDLGDFVSATREVSWNFRNLFEKRHTRQPTRTIEYRRCPMSTSAPKIFENIAINLCFVQAALANGTDSYLLGYMGAIHVLPQGNRFLGPSDEGPLSAESIQFGTDVGRFDVFVKFMRESAKTLGLQQYLKLEVQKPT